MELGKEDLYRIAHLSRLHFDERSVPPMLKSLQNILHWMEKLNEVDTEQVNPLTHMTEEVNVTRKDAQIHNLDREQGQANAPKKEDGYFKVPRVID
jgi:aspartyl-tRNA(Asn)/glutamyl-tRNA(Gln) amidotransferase subunit C